MQNKFLKIISKNLNINIVYWFVFNLTCYQIECTKYSNRVSKGSLIVRAICEQSAKVFSFKETKFLKRKSVGTFNANRSRRPRRSRHFKRTR